MKLDKISFDKYIKGSTLIDAVVRRKDMLYFIFEDDAPRPETETTWTRVITCNDRPGLRPWGIAELKGMLNMKASVAYQPKEQFVGFSLNHHIYAIGSGEVGFEKDLSSGKNDAGEWAGMRGGAVKSKTIDGWLWIVGSGRSVMRRQGNNTWEWHSAIPDRSLMDDGGFEDIDGFSSTDIYAAGGHGDVWHFDGKTWRAIPFPSNMSLETVCCAGDGMVYIGADEGAVFQGRGEQWKLIHRGDTTLSYTDLVWYQDRVWGTSDYGVWHIQNGKVKRAHLPDGVRVCAGHLSAADGVLLLAGQYGATLFDGKQWNRIIDFNNLA
ncbi:hypothetical protein V8J88_06395 [Massilia sp. W12]|uniref:hypothetical protein n=1 Tax=Massilia sp. W12 TaxID=3126507 RepID=UPI0030D5C8C3